MKKKVLAFVMAATMVFSLAACGSSSSGSDSSSNSDASAPAESGDDVQTFKLGSIGPLTGDAAIYGQAVVNGAKRAT